MNICLLTVYNKEKSMDFTFDSKSENNFSKIQDKITEIHVDSNLNVRGHVILDKPPVLGETDIQTTQ